VRSALDCFLQIKQYPKGTEVLMTAINIPDMVQIFTEHGLVPVPVDIDPYTMSPSLEAIKNACTEKTKLALFAFIYGVTYDIAPYAEFLKSEGIEIIEDCAQSWSSLESFRGSPHSIFTMFSFGTIKLNTAFFGAVTIVRDQNSSTANLTAKMDET